MNKISKLYLRDLFPSFIFFLVPTILKGERGEVREFGTDIAYTMYRLLIIPKLGKTDGREYNE